MAERWTLNRAGIINVYQYANETLEFAGGRLLLRGVNGSGKSTAMNMLLPFLLDGDTRRIDAAGDQSGVLKSWMLSGRDDRQPVGYLWIELAYGGRYVTLGCGIKANRASDTVSTWWFVTGRRPGVDLDLVEDRHPLSVESLRSVLTPDPVYRHDQRQAYREEVRARLFGGAELDQHIRLLHIVRNPRVGDRIDVELPEHLHNALPQLSDTALEDAAQPLEELEEHRRNIKELTGTAGTLDALAGIYASYARRALLDRAGEAKALVDQAAQALRDRQRAGRRVTEAERRYEQAGAEIARLAAEEERLRKELGGLRESPAYTEGKELNDLREHVATLARQRDRAEKEAARCASALEERRQVHDEAARTAGEDRRELGRLLSDLSSCAVAAGVAAGMPDLPEVPAVPWPPPSSSAAPAGEGSTGGSDQLLEGPRQALDPEPLHRGLAEVRRAISRRQHDLDEVSAALAAVDRAEQQLSAADRAWEQAVAEAQRLQDDLAASRRAHDDALAAWRDQLAEWAGRLAELRRSQGLPEAALPDLTSELAARRVAVGEALVAAVEAVVGIHLQRVAALDARRILEAANLDDLAARVAELDARALPDPPRLSWQEAGDSVVLAELVDFRPSVDPPSQAGLEAALEAAGLLGAEVTAEGTLRLAQGRLVIRAGRAVEHSLGELLAVTVPEEHRARVDAATVERLLACIATDQAALDGPGDVTVATTDGRFRSGLLRGRHHKPAAEHVGRSARRAALERQRALARQELEAGRAALAATTDELAQAEDRVAAARALREAIPAATQVERSDLAVQLAAEQAARIRRVAGERRSERDRAAESHRQAVDDSRRISATLSLPAEPSALDQIRGQLAEALGLSRQAGERVTGLVRAVGWWRRETEAVGRAVELASSAEAAHHAAVVEHQARSARLGALEESIGAEYEQVVKAIEQCQGALEQCQGALGPARDDQLEWRDRLGVARTQAEELERLDQLAAARAAAALPQLRRALEVPGVLAAALGTAGPGGGAAGPEGGDSEADQAGDGGAGSPGTMDARAVLLAPVEDSPAGVAALAAAIEAHVPEPARRDVTAEGVRQSLRNRRDSLGAGWDAEDHQADESLPLAVEVNGPQGRFPLAEAQAMVNHQLAALVALLSNEQDSALRNLLQGLVAREVADKLHAARELVALMNRRLDTVTTSHGIGVSLRWRRRELDEGLGTMVDLLAKPPDLRTPEQDDELRRSLQQRLDEARREDPEAPFRELIARVLDYRNWHEMALILHRPGRSDERLTRRTALSEGEKKIVSYLPLFAAVAASCDALAETAPEAPRFVLLDDAFAKVSEDNHPKLFGLLVEMDLDFIATSERLWGTHASVPELAITEVLRDADLGVIVLEHSHWDGSTRSAR